MSPGAIAAEDKTTLALQEKLDRLLAKAKPTKRELTLQHFRDLYPRLEAHLATGKLLKDVLAAFNELVQAKVCARTFNDMLDQERARRHEDGSPVCCNTCGQPLRPRSTGSKVNTDTATATASPLATPESE